MGVESVVVIVGKGMDEKGMGGPWEGRDDGMGYRIEQMYAEGNTR
jgi:hypothetical protein